MGGVVKGQTVLGPQIRGEAHQNILSTTILAGKLLMSTVVFLVLRMQRVRFTPSGGEFLTRGPPLENVEGLSSMQTPQITPLLSHGVAPLESLYGGRATFDQLAQL